MGKFSPSEALSLGLHPGLHPRGQGGTELLLGNSEPEKNQEVKWEPGLYCFSLYYSYEAKNIKVKILLQSWDVNH